MRVAEQLVVGAALAAAMASGARAQEATDWSGFYASIFAGYALDIAQAGGSTIGPMVGPMNYDFFQDQQLTRLDGLLAGVGAGYAGQHGQFVLGIDGAVHAGGLGKSESDVLSVGASAGGLFDFNDLTEENKVNIDWYSTLTGSFGVVLEDDWLVYLKGGVALANVSLNSRSGLVIDKNVAGVLPAPAGNYQSGFTSTELVTGGTVGAGIEKMIAPNVSLGAEYAYVALPDVSGRDADAAAMALGAGQNNSYSFPLAFHTVKASLKYHF